MKTITLTTEQAQQIEEALVKMADLRNLGKICPEVVAFETLYIIRAAREQGKTTTPTTIPLDMEKVRLADPLYQQGYNTGYQNGKVDGMLEALGSEQ